MKSIVVLLFVLAGLLVGSALRGSSASACSCAQATWDVQLVGDNASDPTKSHAGLWPSHGRLEAFGGRLRITGMNAPITSVEAHR